MTARFASLLAAAALGTLAAPAMAQDWRDGPPPLPAPPAMHHGDQDDWADEDDWTDQDDRRAGEVDLRGYDQEPRDWRAGPGDPGGDWNRRGPPLGPRFAYSAAERDGWLAQCRDSYRPALPVRDERGRRRGAAIGGVLGGIGGGIAGNRIAGRGDRLEGTLIGAGVGALAGAVAGNAIGASSDRERDSEWGAYCEDYLARYEHGAGPVPGGPPLMMGPGLPYGQPAYITPGYVVPPLMWVRVPIVRERTRDCGCEQVIEEVVVTRPARRALPRPAPSKMVRLRSTK